MDIALSKLLSHVYELEGLLLVADRHGSDTPTVVYDRIREQATLLGQMAQLITPPAKTEPAPAPTPQPEPEPAPQPEPIPQPEPEPEPVQEPEPAIEPEPVAPPAHVPEPVPLDEPEIDAPAPEPDDDDVLRPPFSFSEPTLRVDQKLQRTISKDLRKAFSINDRFRFRRELFEGSEAEFVDAINMIEAMHSYEEAQDYFLGDLGWDINVPEVEEFLGIVRNHFA